MRQHESAIICSWVDEIYSERRTTLASALSYEQLVGFLPECLESISQLLDSAATDAEILEVVTRLRSYAQVRFQQGLLIDEVVREFTILRRVLNDFLWQEGARTPEGDWQSLRSVLQRVNQFADELIAQALLVYAASLRPPVETRSSVWPPPRRRKAFLGEPED
ncbi:MAG: RsbRD N-terminal domain-containing protein [Pyrinomonadaceae bacterium]